MGMGAELGQYILQTILKIQWGGLNPLTPSVGTPVYTNNGVK